MRRELGWTIAVAAAFTIGATCAQPYARLVAPYGYTVASLIAEFHPWKIVGVDVVNEQAGPGVVLRLTGEVRRARSDPERAALVLSRLHVGPVVETPLVFWTLLLVWPTRSVRQRLVSIAVGLPVFLGLEVVTTVLPLLTPLAWASAVLDGHNDPVTVWDHWSRFLEDGGRFALEAATALLTIAIVTRLRSRETVAGSIGP